MSEDGNSFSEQRKLNLQKCSEGENVGNAQDDGDAKLGTVHSKNEAVGIDLSWFPSVPNFQIDSAQRSVDPLRLPAGNVYSDFFIRREIGRGAFGVVYLAEQLSLNRTVALKVTDTTRDDGCYAEGQTMAQLEHPSIVRVFAQSADNVNNRRLLCMQYVSGLNLRTLIKNIQSQYRDQWNGRNLLQILEEGVEEEEIVLSSTSVADRDAIAGADKLASVCWIGAQAAFGLEHAHRAGYVHNDVKPENTIINRFGRPMLVDFNLAMDSTSANRPILGGTVHYMPPETIQDFAAKDDSNSADAFAADVYALGVMLWELYVGVRPFADIGAEAVGDSEQLKVLIDSRKLIAQSDRIDGELAKCLQKAVHFDTKQRYGSAEEFGQTLLGVARQVLAINSRSEDNWLCRLVVRRPVTSVLVASLAPHVVASGFQIAYNQAEIISRLTPSAIALFKILLFCVNPIVYGICAFFAIKYLFAILKPWQRFTRGDPIAAHEVELARRDLMLFPQRAAIIGGLGWLGGVVGFPVTIYLLAQRFSIDVWLHFICSFAISGMIAVTFSYMLILAVAVYAIYPTLFAKPDRFVDESRRQLEPIRARWSTLSMLAGAIPLIAAILIVVNFHAADLIPTADNPYREIAFKGLVTGLIVASAFGFEFVRRIGKSVIRLIDICVSPQNQ